MIETKRLMLRPIALSDASDLFELFCDPVANHFLPWFAHQTINDTRLFIQARYLNVPYRMGIVLKESGRMIGIIGVSPGEANDFGYALHPHHWHQGFATEAGLAMLDHLRECGVPYVTATHDVLNPASGRVLSKLGFNYAYTYRELWQPKNHEVDFRFHQRNLAQEDAPLYLGYQSLYPNHWVETL